MVGFNNTKLEIGDYKKGATDLVGVLQQTRPALGGNVMATIMTKDSQTQMATVRPGVFKVPALDHERSGEVIRSEVELEEDALGLETTPVESFASKTSIRDAEVIVSGGTINSPHLLQISGVGPAEHLKSIGVEVVHDQDTVHAGVVETAAPLGAEGDGGESIVFLHRIMEMPYVSSVSSNNREYINYEYHVFFVFSSFILCGSSVPAS